MTCTSVQPRDFIGCPKHKVGAQNTRHNRYTIVYHIYSNIYSTTYWVHHLLLLLLFLHHFCIHVYLLNKQICVKHEVNYNLQQNRRMPGAGHGFLPHSPHSMYIHTHHTQPMYMKLWDQTKLTKKRISLSFVIWFASFRPSTFRCLTFSFRQSVGLHVTWIMC